ncbi:WD repeat-containing protein 46 [Mugil cephalus]|uniref:WD repeat-containing protein 46 n=1 Tax=Mugil cephalus TaxID=48193 RepID=UPI001FB78CF8|nr:WD repeat-containing protein 46 [Mugil cephalus]XP_047438689.1 WD repeat-containing protein 46 [Mugil cephalus]XP_047438696.1 WD repeat-containing protein 46 [Mugil cephalus]
MASPGEAATQDSHVGKKKKPPARYWDKTQEEEKRGNKAENDGEQTGPALQQKEQKTRKRKKRKEEDKGDGKKFISGKSDPFPGPAPIPKDRVQKFKRKDKTKKPARSHYKLKDAIARSEDVSEMAQKQAARFDLLLPEDAGFLEGDEDEDTCTISQEDIAEAVDITSGAKYFNLKLSQFGPYRLDYSRTGRHLLLGGRRGHVACIDWLSKQLMCEINVMESVNDVKWLHSEAMYAVAQKKWLYIYDSSGIELHCIRKFNDVLRMQFLPYHFLLATASATGFLQYLDVSVGKEVAAICTKTGRLDVMCQNPNNAIIHLGHSNGTVTLWSPNQKEALVKMLCHKGGVRSVTVDKTGTYMVTSGMDKKLKVYDVRAFKPLQSYFLPAGASCLSLSQRGVLSVSTGDIVQVYRDVWSTPVTKPYMAHRVRGAVWGLHFCPFEDVLGVGHADGFTSMLVPGAGEPNFDGLDANPYRSAKQRQEWEVKALLEKIQPELISLDPTELGRVDIATFTQRHQDRVAALGFDPLAKEKFIPKYKKKGRSSAGGIERRKKQVAHEDQRDEIRKTVEDKVKKAEEQKARERKKAVLASQKSALDRFKK